MELYSYLTIEDEKEIYDLDPFLDSIRELGFSFDFLREKLKGIQDDKIAFNIIATQKDLVFSLIKNLSPYSLEKFQGKKDTIGIPNNEQAYLEFINNLDLETISDQRVKSILGRVKKKEFNCSVRGLINNFKIYFSWLEKLSVKFETITLIHGDQNTLEDKLKDLEIFDKNLFVHILELNSKIQSLASAGKPRLKGRIVDLVIELYLDYKSKYPEKTFFFNLVYSSIELPVQWDLKKFLKYCYKYS